MYLISACLLGENCKYNGENNYSQAVEIYCGKTPCVAVCPEVLGGLGTPRSPCELQKDRVVTPGGRDLTEAFQRGAQIALDQGFKEAKERGETIELAILKARSPSCGFREIYDGTFSSVRIPGDGIFAELLTDHQIPIMTEEDI